MGATICLLLVGPIQRTSILRKTALHSANHHRQSKYNDLIRLQAGIWIHYINTQSNVLRHQITHIKVGRVINYVLMDQGSFCIGL